MTMGKFTILSMLLSCFCLSAWATAEDGTSQLVEELLQVGLPIVQIETINHEEPTYDVSDAPEGCWGSAIQNAVKVPGRLLIRNLEGVLYDSGEYLEKEQGMTIKVRGNGSARMEGMKPYKIKLQKKADLLNRGDARLSDKNWLLLKVENLNTIIGFKMNELMGLQWAPQCRFVNVVFNGEYRGLYLLAESVERNVDARLRVDKTAGFIFELDAYWWNEDYYIPSEYPVPMNYTFKYPDVADMTDDQKAYMTDLLQTFDESTEVGGYDRWMDVDAFARWMLAHDLLGSTDGGGSNVYLTKYDQTENSLITMPCLWDFDAIHLAEEWDAAHNLYFFHNLFQCDDKTFVRRYVELWNEKKDDIYDRLITFLDDFAASEERPAVDASIHLNNLRWNIWVAPTADHIATAKTYYQNRQVWLETAIAELDLDDDAIEQVFEQSPRDRITRQSTSAYDLYGRLLHLTANGSSQLQKGIYIMNGKKYVKSSR